MDPLSNPFAPGAGARPPELVGRETELEDFRVLLGRAGRGRASAPLVLYGLRGVGKTVLLQAFAAAAEDAGWLTVSIEAGGSMGGSAGSGAASQARTQLGRELARIGHKLKRRDQPGRFGRALASIEGLSLTVGLTSAGLSLSRKTQDKAEHQALPGDLELGLLDLVEDLAPELAKDSVGLAIFADEVQDFDTETLAALITVQHRASQRAWPFYVIGAGLPSLLRRLGDIRSYTERWAYRRIDKLTSEQAREVLAGPVAAEGASFEPAALDRLVAAADGYPYFLQCFGDQAWRLAQGTVITAADAAEAIRLGWKELDEGFFMTRWARATVGEREFLRAMLPDAGRSSSTSVIGDRLGQETKAVSAIRTRLIQKGLIYPQARGEVAFTVPGIAGFIDRNPE